VIERKDIFGIQVPLESCMLHRKGNVRGFKLMKKVHLSRIRNH